MNTHKKTLLHLIRERAYKQGDFILSSGRKTQHYINCKPVTLSCEGNALLSHLLIEKVEKDAVAVGGLTLGADPLVCGVAQKAYYTGDRHLDALIVRKNPKGHGTKEVIEGNKPPKGSVVTVLEVHSEQFMHYVKQDILSIVWYPSLIEWIVTQYGQIMNYHISHYSNLKILLKNSVGVHT